MNREVQLGLAFVEAADTLADDFDVDVFLHALATRCVQLLPVDAAGLMLADQRGRLQASCATSENARLLALFELQSGAGPCLDAFSSGHPVAGTALDAGRERWPNFAEAGRALEFDSVHALPLRRHAEVIGVLSLLRAGPGALDDTDSRTGQALADVATIGLLAQRSRHQAALLSDQLQQALTSRVMIEQAKGILAERYQITPGEAFCVLRRYSRRHRLRLTDLAELVAQQPAVILQRDTIGSFIS